MVTSMVSTVGAARFSCSPSVQRLPNANHRSPPFFRLPPSRRASGLAVRAEGGIVNPSVRKEEGKVVDEVQVAELSKPLTVYCRCWRSGTFPLCDGSHVKHNKETGDNVGPLLLKKQKE